MFKTIVKSFSKRLACFSVRHASCVPITTVTRFPNGVRIATEVTLSQMACVTLAVAVGPRYETSYTNGSTHFIEHLAFKGCRSMKQNTLEKAVSDMGGKLSVQTYREEQIFSVVLPSANADKAANILGRVITELDINDTKIKEERANISRELADADIDPKKVLFDYLNASAFQGTPLGQRVIGPTENLERFNADVTRSFLCENYVPHRLCLASTGAVSSEVLANAVCDTLACIPAVSIGELGPTRYTGSQVVFRDDSMPLCHVAIAFEAPGYGGDTYYKMMVLSYIIGAWDRSQGRGEGQSSAVARWAAIGKLCERYQPFYTVYRDVGLWGVYFVADKWKLDEVVTRVQNEWMEMCTMLRTPDLERGVRLARLNLARQYNSVVWNAHDLGRKMLHINKRKSLKCVNALLANTTVAELRKLADHYLYDRCPTVAVVGPSETMPDYLRIRSGMWWLRL